MTPAARGNGARRRARLFAWWYLCLGLGFVLLAVRSWIAGVRPWGVALRFVIAAGFLALAAVTFQSLGRSRQRADRPSQHTDSR